MLCLATITGNAQGIDFFTNKQYEYSNCAKEFNLDRPYLEKAIEIEYSCIHDNNKTYDAINASILDWCKNYIDTEAAFNPIKKEAYQRLEFYNNSDYARRRSSEAFDQIVLQSISCSLKSASAGQILYEISFSFGADDRYQRNALDFSVKKYILLNLTTGKIILWQPNVNINAKVAIEKWITKNKDSGIVNKKTNAKNNDSQRPVYDDDDANIYNAHTKYPLNIKNANVYWDTFGLVVAFQDYTQEAYNESKEYAVFIPYKDALKITALMPEFAFINIQPPVKTVLNGVDAFESQNVHIKTDHTLQDFIVPGTTVVKKVVQANYSIGNEGQKELWQTITYEYDKAQNMVCKKVYDAKEKLLDSTHTTYNLNNMPQTITYKNNEGFFTTAYTYDERNNLEKKENRYGNTYFFYNGNFAYKYVILGDERIVWMEIKDGVICRQSSCSIFDNKGRVLATDALKFRMYDAQSGRDSLGNIVETHHDSDRAHSYFEYDRLNRLTNVNKYESSYLKFKRSFIYEANKLFPALSVTKADYNNVEEHYVWEFYE